MKLQFFGGRGSGGSTGSKNTGSKKGETTKSNSKYAKMSETEAEEAIESLKPKRFEDGVSVLNPNDSDLGVVRIEQDYYGGFRISGIAGGEVTDIDTTGVITRRDANRAAREWLKGKWRTIYG